MSGFGERLKRLRNRTGKTQAEVAAEISEHFPKNKISQTGLSSLENRATAPREDVLSILAEYYGVRTNYFFAAEKTDAEKHSQRSRALEYVDEVKRREIASTGRISAHASRFRQQGDPIQKVLDYLDEKEG